MRNEDLKEMMVSTIAHLQMLAMHNPNTPLLLAGVLRLDDGTDQYRIYQINQPMPADTPPDPPKTGQRICFVGKGPPSEPDWVVALFELEAGKLEDTMTIPLPLHGTTEYLAQRIYEYLVFGTIVRQTEPPAFTQ